MTEKLGNGVTDIFLFNVVFAGVNVSPPLSSPQKHLSHPGGANVSTLAFPFNVTEPIHLKFTKLEMNTLSKILSMLAACLESDTNLF